MNSRFDDGEAHISQYQRDQLHAIEQWRRDEPSVISTSLGLIVEPLAWLVQKVVPESAVIGALSASNTAAVWMADSADILRDGGVGDVSDLIGKDLRLSDRLAEWSSNARPFSRLASSPILGQLFWFGR